MHVDELVCCSLGKTVSIEQPHHVRSKISTGLYTDIKMTSTWYLRGKSNIFLLDNFLYGKFYLLSHLYLLYWYLIMTTGLQFWSCNINFFFVLPPFMVSLGIANITTHIKFDFHSVSFSCAAFHSLTTHIQWQNIPPSNFTAYPLTHVLYVQKKIPVFL